MPRSNNKQSRECVQSVWKKKTKATAELESFKAVKGDITQHQVDIQAMWWWVISPF